MSHDDSSRDVACTLTEEQEQERREDVRSRLIAYYLGYEETDNGLTIRFDGTDQALRAVAEFTASELQCCAFAVSSAIDTSMHTSRSDSGGCASPRP